MSLPGSTDATAQQKASAVKKAYQAQLMSKANVVGVGVGLKKQSGQNTDTVALIVMVTKKVPRSQLASEDILPSQIEGVQVDVQEVGDIRAL